MSNSLRAPSAAAQEDRREATPTATPQAAERRSSLPRWALLAGPVLLLLAMLAAGQVLKPTDVFTLRLVVVYALFAIATNLLIGYGGLVSFGQAAFFGTGAYVVALGWLHWETSFWLTLALAPVVGGFMALLVGAIALRTRRLYFALLTLAFSQLFFVVANAAHEFTRGADGIFGAIIPEFLRGRDPVPGYVFILTVTAVASLALWKVTASPFGLVLRASRENRERMQALGVNVYTHQLMAFVIAGTFCALAGALYVVAAGSATLDLLEWTQSGNAVYMVVIGGMFSFLGPALGAAVYTFGVDYVTQSGLGHWQLFLGLGLLVTVIFRPDGLVGLFSPSTWRSWWRGRQDRRESAATPTDSANGQETAR